MYVHPPMLAPVQHLSLASQVADRLIEAIGVGRFEAEARLIETELAAELGVSRVPVREALRLLESQGLVVSKPHRGTRLIRFDNHWAAQLYEVRQAVELVATRRAAAVYRHSKDRRSQLETRIEKITARADEEDRVGVNQADLDFHEQIYRDADSPLLTSTWQAIRRHVRVAFAKETGGGVDLDLIAEQHTRLFEVMMSDDETALAAEIDDHISGPLSLLGPLVSQAA